MRDDMTKALVTVTILLLFPLTTAADNLKSKHERITRALENENFTQAEKELREIEKSSPDDFARNNYDYLLARIRERVGDQDGAATYFQRVVNRGSILSEYALWHLAGIGRAKASLASEQAYLKQLVEKRPTSLLRDRAERRLADSLFEGGAFASAIQAYQKFASGRGQSARQAQLKIALAYKQLKRTGEARSGFEQLMTSGRDDAALQATRELDRLDRESSTTLSPEDHLKRARLYQANRAFDEARWHYRQVVDRASDSRFAPEAIFEIGRGYYQRREFDNAVEWFERAHERFPQTREGEQGYYQVGHAHARLGRWQKAVERYERLLAEYPKSEFIQGAHLNAIDALRSGGQDQAALEWCQRTINRFPGELAAVTALYSQARIHLAQDDLASALEDLNQLLQQNLNRPGPSAPNRQEAIYIRGVVLEKLGRLDEAVAEYLSLPDVRGNYYGQRATLRLGDLAARREAKPLIERRFKRERDQARRALKAKRYEQAKDAARQALRLAPNDGDKKKTRQLLADILRRLPEYRRLAALQLFPVGRPALTAKARRTAERAVNGLAQELIFLGLYDEGAPELAANNNNGNAASVNRAYTLAHYFNLGGHADEAIRIGETQLASLIPTDYPLELLPRELVSTLYPAPYRRLIEEHIAKHATDPALALAVMREESRFQADAKSPAAARGLMQFVMETARPLAEKSGLPQLTEDDLYKPEISIRLAGVHLKELFQKFPGNAQAVAASYNAGDDNVERWSKRVRASEPDRFVIEIGFRETKEYVYRVMSNYWAYQRILGEGDEK
jgi:soluble lytic murein transglycosylase